MFHQDLDDSVSALVVRFDQPQFGEHRVLPHQVGDRSVELADDFGQSFARWFRLEVLDSVELDTALLKNLQSVGGRVSMRVVEERDGSHDSIIADGSTGVVQAIRSAWNQPGSPRISPDQPGARIAANTSTAPWRSSISGA